MSAPDARLSMVRARPGQCLTYTPIRHQPLCWMSSDSTLEHVPGPSVRLDASREYDSTVVRTGKFFDVETMIK